MQQEQKSAQKIDNTQAVWSVAIEMKPNAALCRSLTPIWLRRLW
jgi:hypothetical protein